MSAPRSDGSDTGEPGFDDVTEQELRERADLNWAQAPDDVLPAWVAEMDYSPPPAVQRRSGRSRPGSAGSATRRRRRSPGCGRPRRVSRPPSTTGRSTPELVVPTGDVMAGVMLAIETLCDLAPVVVPTPAYPPFLEAVPLTGRELVAGAPRSRRRAGRARPGPDRGRSGRRRAHRAVVQPPQPLGAVMVRAELTDLRDVVARHGARVVSDEIHASAGAPRRPAHAVRLDRRYGGARHDPAVGEQGLQRAGPQVRPDRGRAPPRTPAR